jgi:hypothetical protein
MPPASTEVLVRIARAHQAQLLAVRDRTRLALETLWSHIVTDPSTATAERWVATSVPFVEAAQRAAASAALGYVTAYSAAATGIAPTPTELTAADFINPRRTPLPEVLQRPIVTMRRALSEGKPLHDALAAGVNRAAQIGATDPMLSARAASSAAMQADPHIVGYRRVPDAGACKFCLLVSTQRYHDDDLMALHVNCGCTVAPIIGRHDPGRVLDRGLVDQLMTADPALGRRGESREHARQLAAADLRKANDLTAVHMHGELGPTLYGAGQHFAAL